MWKKKLPSSKQNPSCAYGCIQCYRRIFQAIVRAAYETSKETLPALCVSFLSEIADKFEKCVNLFEFLKDKFCDKTNPLNESENDCDDDDDMEPADSVSLITASSASVTSSKSSIVKQIKLERRRSKLQVLEDLARSRKAKVEAEEKAAVAKAKAEASPAAALATTAAAAAKKEETLAELL